MSIYPEEKISEVKEAADLVELISHYVSLKRAGTNYKGLCPFHSEKTPSFTVSPNKGLFRCFGCGVGGDAIHFMMKISGCGFPEAVSELARRYGVDLPEPSGVYSGGIRPDAANRAGIFEVLKAAQDFFAANLWANEGIEARRYLARRGLTQRVTRDFSLGLALPGWAGLHEHLSASGFGDKIMLEAGLIKPGREGNRHYDAFRGRLMVPIFDPEGRVAAFGGRLLDDEPNQPKYLNSPETAVYKKGRLLYGYHRARPFLRAAGLVFLVEGYFDLISLVAGGVNEVVATLGTALTPGHLNLLKSHIREVMLVFDSDEAGQRAAARALPLLLNAELDGRVLKLPEGHDPDTFIREFGAEAFYEAASKAMDIVEFQVARLKRAHPPTLAGQARLVREAREILGQVSDSAKSRLLRRRLAQLLDLEESMLGELKKKHRTLTHSPAASSEVTGDPVAKELLRFILIHPESAGTVLTEMAAYWPDDATRPLFVKLKTHFENKGLVRPEDASGDYPPDITSMVAETAFAERSAAPDESVRIAGEYMERLMDKWRKSRQLQLSSEIAAAEARGDSEAVALLLREKMSLHGK